MSRYSFQSPGAAAGNAIEQFLVQRALDERQRQLDAFARRDREATQQREAERIDLENRRMDTADKATADERMNRRAGIALSTMTPGVIAPGDAAALRGTDYEGLLDRRNTLPSQSMAGDLASGTLARTQDAGGDAFDVLKPTAKQQQDAAHRQAVIGVMDLVKRGAPRNQIAAGLLDTGQDLPASLLGEDPATVEARHQANELAQIHARGDEDRRTAGVRGAGGGGIDYSGLADAIISGDQPPDINTRSQYGMRLQSELAKKGFNLSTAVTDWRATQRHFQTLNGPQQTRIRQAASTAYESLDVIDQLAGQWKGSGFPLLNKANLAAAKQGAYGQQVASVAQQLDAQIADLTSELANVYMGGNSPTDHALELAHKNLNAEWSEKVLKDMTALARKNLQYRLNSIQHVGAITSSNPTGGEQPAAGAAGGPRRGRYNPTTGEIEY